MPIGAISELASGRGPGAGLREPVLVTGATGFTGGHLARRLRQLGHPVRALVRAGADPKPLLAQGIEVVEGDITRAADVERAAAGVCKIFHIAAVFRTAGHPDSYYYAVNLGGTQNVLAAARRHGVERVLHCSTVGVHGGVHDIPSTEESPFNPGDIYQRTKLAGEQAAREACAWGLPVTVVRPSPIYGPGDLRLLKLFRTVENGTFRMFGSGEAFFHLVYIDDLIDGMLLCAERPEALGQVFILAGPRYLRLNEIVELIAGAVGVPPPRGRLPMWPLMAAAAACEAICRPLHVEPPLHRRRADFFRKNRAFSTEKARCLLGYEPRVDPQDGIHRTAQWYFENGHLGGAHRRRAAS
ncbi:MAG TPA: NAD-dependent epimerase/dehydratase family protein [Thermoanaerobaculia bacterium]|nr:NAD-dependent epimerase/dehydratase family protein [Thermoanaerobaculia bacterium]